MSLALVLGSRSDTHCGPLEQPHDPLDRVQTRKVQRRPLVVAAAEVEGLDGLARRAFHQIVEGGEDD